MRLARPARPISDRVRITHTGNHRRQRLSEQSLQRPCSAFAIAPVSARTASRCALLVSIGVLLDVFDCGLGITIKCLLLYKICPEIAIKRLPKILIEQR
jgi:hypothetical protein